jgi:putative endonuclease
VLQQLLCSGTNARRQTCKSIGNRGERLAVAFLKQNGFRIVARNKYFGKDELDILAFEKKQNTLVVVEVRTTARRAGAPERTITHKKRRAMGRISRRLLTEAKRNNCALRTDLITVRIYGKDPDIRHYRGILPR